jgi:hypothetical protein
MKAFYSSSLILLLLFIEISLSAQENIMNEISLSNYSICYANINDTDSIPFLKVEGLATNLISEELVFALDLEIDNSIDEIEEEIFVEVSYSNEAVNINDIEYNELMIMPLLSLSLQMGIEFYGVISKK